MSIKSKRVHKSVRYPEYFHNEDLPPWDMQQYIGLLLSSCPVPVPRYTWRRKVLFKNQLGKVESGIILGKKKGGSSFTVLDQFFVKITVNLKDVVDILGRVKRPIEHIHFARNSEDETDDKIF